MKEFRTSRFILIKDYIYGAAFALISFFMIFALAGNLWAALVIGVSAGAVVTIFALRSDDAHFQLNDGVFAIYVQGKRKYQYTLSECSFIAHIKYGNNDRVKGMRLEITSGKGLSEDNVLVDCNMLGTDGFKGLIESIKTAEPAPKRFEIRKID